MIRNSRTRPKEASDDPETDANFRIDWGPDVSNIERLIVDTSPLPMAALAGSNHILRYVNTAFCRLARKAKNELMGKPFTEVVAWKCCLASLNHVYSSGEVAIQTESEQTADNAPWSYAMWPVCDPEDHTVGVIMHVMENTRFRQRAIAVNEQLLLSGVRQHELIETAERMNAKLQLEVADRKRMERALVNSEKLAVTARFALTMAHEINNPLEAIANLVYLLAPLQTSPEAQAYITTIEDQLKGLSRIATQMLKFHRDSNNPAVFKLDAVLREVLEFYRPQAERQGIVIHQRWERGWHYFGLQK
jgi:hypothetical protein